MVVDLVCGGGAVRVQKAQRETDKSHCIQILMASFVDIFRVLGLEPPVPAFPHQGRSQCS